MKSPRKIPSHEKCTAWSVWFPEDGAFSRNDLSDNMERDFFADCIREFIEGERDWNAVLGRPPVVCRWRQTLRRG